MALLLRTCQHCGKEIKGRSDKKFCDDSCRNAFAFANRNKIDPFTPTIDILKKNYEALETLYRSHGDGNPVSREELYKAGYNFDYCTAHYFFEKRDYYFNFGLGIMHLDADQLFVIWNRSSFDYEVEYLAPAREEALRNSKQ